jgi:hypothetical protein
LAIDYQLAAENRRVILPLQLYCNPGEFIDALENRSLPGGVKYNIFTAGENIGIEDKNNLFRKIKKYRTEEYKGKPKT